MTLEEWMKANKVKGKDLAEAIKCSKPFLAQIKNKQAQPSLNLAVRINEHTEGAVTFKEMLVNG